jgi:hypothetical protein
MRLLLLFFALGTGACGLALDFEEEGLACDARGLCLEGYACVDGSCLRDEALRCLPCDGGAGCAAPDGGSACR